MACMHSLCRFCLALLPLVLLTLNTNEKVGETCSVYMGLITLTNLYERKDNKHLNRKTDKGHKLAIQRDAMWVCMCMCMCISTNKKKTTIKNALSPQF